MKDYIKVHDAQSLNTEIALRKEACVMVCKVISTGQALIRMSSDPRMPGVACSESYEDVLKLLNGEYIKQNDQEQSNIPI